MKWRIMIAAAALAAYPAQAQSQPVPIGITKAVTIAEKTTGGRAMDADLDHRRDGKLVYEVELVKDRTLHEIDVDAHSGRILARRTPRIETYWARWFNDQELQGVAKARPLSRILDDLERRTGGQVIEVSFDVEAGQARYEVEISTRAGVTDIFLDPRTGARLAHVYDD